MKTEMMASGRAIQRISFMPVSKEAAIVRNPRSEDLPEHDANAADPVSEPIADAELRHRELPPRQLRPRPERNADLGLLVHSGDGRRGGRRVDDGRGFLLVLEVAVVDDEQA